LRDRENDQTPIIVMNWPPFSHALLELVGVHQRCIFPIRNRTLRINEPILPLVTKRGRSYSVNVLKENFAFLRQRAQESNGLLPTDQTRPAAQVKINTRRLAIDRAKAPRGANYDAVLTELNDRGFQTLKPEQLSVIEQIEQFAQADLIVGEDGSALHNAGFSQRGTSLIVLSRGDKINYWHGAVACAAGLKLDYIASGENEYEGHSHSVDIDTLRSVVRRRMKRLPYLSLKRTLGRASRALRFSR
jgi:capsular polysaccharide biosynthesis protein